MPKIEEERKEQLALNLIDLDNLDPQFRRKVLKDRLNLQVAIPVEMDRANPSRAVAFSCGLMTAALCCDIIRSENRRGGDAPIRVYLKRADAWTRLPDKAVLTLIERGTAILNPEVFALKVRPEDLTPLAPKRLF